jgi:hypothetical protein
MRQLLLRDLAVLINGEGFERVPLYLGPIGNLIYFFFTFSVGKTISLFNYPVIVVTAITYLVILISFFRAFLLNKFQRDSAIFIVSSLLITTTLCAFSNYNSPRYIMASGVLYSIIISLGILNIPNRKLAVSLIIVICMLRSYSLYNFYNEREFRAMEFHDDWDDIASFVNSKSSSDGIIIYECNAFFYYLGKTGIHNNSYMLPDNEDDLRVFIKDKLENRKITNIIIVDSPLSGNNIEIYRAELMLLRDWLKSNSFKPTQIKRFDRDSEAALKRRYLKRDFPEYRNTVYLYSKE